ncbi:MAG: signal peptidase I [Clostridia bacterium]|nr:signal peptidase I [Clostridia bacterium]
MEQTLTRVERNRSSYAGYRAADIGVRILVGLILSALLVFVVFTPVVVAGNGMYPALLNGDVVLISRFAHLIRTPARGEAVAYERDSNVYIGRIIAFAGETVMARDGNVYIDGALLDESTYSAFPSGDFGPVTLEPGQVFAICDNRTLADGDASSYIVSYDDLWGVVRIRVYPKLNTFGAG